MTSENGNAIIEALGELLADRVSPEAVRAIETERDASLVWPEIEALGYPDAMLAEDNGGAGINLEDLGELAWLCGYHALPFPLADTIVARAAWAETRALQGPILLTLGQGSDSVRLRQTPQALVARWLISAPNDRTLLVDAVEASLVPAASGASLAASASFAASAARPLASAPVPLLRIVAALRAADMAGGMQRIVELTAGYAMERKQFGKPIGSFQAIQQQIAVMVEETATAGMAARRCFRASGHLREIPVAAAKLRANRAASRVLEIGHAVHGAIGISEEYALQFHSRRLIERKMEAGSADYWAAVIGRERIGKAQGSSIDFIRGQFA